MEEELEEKLKTLKDFELSEDIKDKLKQEAFRWIEVVKTGSNKEKWVEDWAEEEVNKWIKHFFNITEEDLE